MSVDVSVHTLVVRDAELVGYGALVAVVLAVATAARAAKARTILESILSFSFGCSGASDLW